MDLKKSKITLLFAVFAATIGVSCASFPDVPKDALPTDIKVFVKTSTPDIIRIVNDQGLVATLTFEAFERGEVEKILKEVKVEDFKTMVRDTLLGQIRNNLPTFQISEIEEDANLTISLDLLTWDFRAGPVDLDKKMDDLNFAHAATLVGLQLITPQEGKVIWKTSLKATENIWLIDDLVAENPVNFWQRAIDKALVKPILFLKSQFEPKQE